jgi:hypothetical protein
MKIYKTVAFSSLAILVLTAILVASIPFFFPNSIIAWKPMLIFSVPGIALAVLLFIRPALTLRAFRISLALAAMVSIIATYVGWMAFVVLCIFLAALGALYIQGEWQERR